MNKKFDAKKTFDLCLGAAAALLLALLLWRFSPGPEWIAMRTAKDYLEQHVPEYCQIECTKGTAVHYYFPYKFRIPVSQPTWLIVGQLEGGREGEIVRLELKDGSFPTEVTQAEIYTYDKNGNRVREVLPVSG